MATLEYSDISAMAHLCHVRREQLRFLLYCSRLLIVSDYIFVRRGTSCQIAWEIFCRFWNLRDQMYSCRICHERILGICDVLHKKYNLGELLLNLHVCLPDHS